jgi:hypothetical protein
MRDDHERPHFTLKTLLAVVMVVSVLLGLASTWPGALLWLLILGGFYGPIAVAWFFVQRPSLLAITVFLVHTAAVLAVELFWHVSGQPPEFVKVAIHAFYEIWLLPLYLAVEPSGSWRLMISLIVGGLSWAWFAWAFGRWRLNERARKRRQEAQAEQVPHAVKEASVS